MDTEEIKEELNSSFKIKKVSLKWVFGGIDFERDDFLKLYERQDHVTEIVNKSFIERLVMHYEFTKESVEDSVNSLNDNAEFLDMKIRELRGKLSKEAYALIRILEELRSLCTLHAKKIYNLNKEMEEGNKFEFESNFKIRPSDWLQEPIREFRLAIYPLIRVLIDVIPEESSTKTRALDLWFSGRKHLEERDKERSNPNWKPIREE